MVQTTTTRRAVGAISWTCSFLSMVIPGCSNSGNSEVGFRIPPEADAPTAILIYHEGRIATRQEFDANHPISEAVRDWFSECRTERWRRSNVN